MKRLKNGDKIAERFCDKESKPVLLLAAINKLRENMHLTEGDDCTLKELRDAVETIEPNWR